MPETHWDALYKNVLGNLEAAKKAVDNEVKPVTVSPGDWTIRQTNKLAIIDLLQVYTFQILVDTYGNVPYFEALNPDLVLPKYDDAYTIYKDLLSRVDEDLKMLDTSQKDGFFGEYLLEGKVEKWKLFANSLKLKIGINLTDVDPALAKLTIEEAYKGGVVLKSSDNIAFKFVTTAPHYNSIYAAIVGSGRNDYVVEKTIVDKLKALDDPRKDVYFQNKIGGVEIGGVLVGGEYVGGVLGIGNDYPSCSHVGKALIQKETPHYLFDSSEINFYLAEAAEKGYSVGNTSEYYYETAIKGSFEQWNIPAAQVTTYLAHPDVKYPTTGSKQEKINKIAEQVWIAMFNRGFESWTTWRRLDYPVLTAPNAVTAAEGKVPVRVTYPVPEQTLNGANWTEAVAAIGGDKLSTKLFWDKN
jgi:hypothetical protein